MNQQEKFEQMTTKPVKKLINKLAVPTVISMLVTTFYNMADTYFVSKIKGDGNQSTIATGAVSVIFAFMAIIQACGFFFGHGSGNYISRELGNGNHEEAQKMASAGFFSAFVFGLLISVLGYIFIKPLAVILGSTNEILPYAIDYLKMILLGVPFMTSSLVLNNQLRFQGNAMYGMVGITSGAILNVGLDPLFINGIGMGVAGAGLATIISQFVSFVILFIGSRKGDNAKISIKKLVISKFYALEIIRGGLPSLARQSIASVATICLNNTAKIAANLSCTAETASAYATSAIAAFGVVSKIMLAANAVVIGCGQGFQPVCGFNYGAKKYDRVKEAFWYTFKIGMVFSLAMTIILNIFNSQVINIFKDLDEDAKRIARETLRFQSIPFSLSVFVTMSNMLMQNIGEVGKATLLAVSRQGLMFIPFVFILAYTFKMTGVELAQMLADVTTFILAVPLGIGVLKNLGKTDKNPKNDENV